MKKIKFLFLIAIIITIYILININIYDLPRINYLKKLNFETAQKYDDIYFNRVKFLILILLKMKKLMKKLLKLRTELKKMNIFEIF